MLTYSVIQISTLQDKNQKKRRLVHYLKQLYRIPF